jgi:hypothetical protein
MIDLENERITILKSAAKSRTREVMHYQINIDNYRLAIIEIDEKYADDPALMDFRNNLSRLYVECIVEQKKEQIMLDIINRQIGKMKLDDSNT